MIPDVPASKIHDAIRRFDNDFRAAAEWANWEQDRNHRYAVLYNGRRYPVKQIIRLATGATDFSGGDEANSFARARGFEIVSLRDEEDSSRTSIRDGLEWVLANYTRERTRPFGGEGSAAAKERFQTIRGALQNSSAVSQYPNLQIKESIGQGNWAAIPWISLLDRRITTTTQSGVYVVFLFRADMSAVYLTLNQGVTEPQQRLGSAGGREFLRQRASDIRKYSGQLANAGFRLDNNINLRVEAGLGQQYESSTVAYKLYERGKVPQEDVILQDLEAVLAAYANHVNRTASTVPPTLPGPTHEPPPAPAPRDADLRTAVDEFSAALRTSNVSFGPGHEELVRRFVVSLATKRFVILTGLSGSGKTQLALKFGEWLGPNQMYVAAVRPDWTGGEALFGFEDALQAPQDGRRAWSVPEPLRFMLNAAKNHDRPFLLILDEMNLAHVERYFADILSGMESGVECLPNLEQGPDGLWRVASSGPTCVPVPSNLFVVGTVNVDETTYMFSPKVLDRANTFEFRVKTQDLLATARRPSRCAPGSPTSVADFARIASDPDWHAPRESARLAEFISLFRNLHEMLAVSGFEYGHRTFLEAIRFTSLLAAAGDTDPIRALDYQVMQKVLPRLHGSHRRLMPVLASLGRFCLDPDAPASQNDADSASFDPEATTATPPKLPLSFDKVRRMTTLLRANKFVSFTE